MSNNKTVLTQNLSVKLLLSISSDMDMNVQSTTEASLGWWNQPDLCSPFEIDWWMQRPGWWNRMMKAVIRLVPPGLGQLAPKCLFYTVIQMLLTSTMASWYLCYWSLTDLLFLFSGKAKFIGELLVPVAPFDQKSGRETWTVAFAPDGSYFAWSQGHRIVRLVPWSKCLKNL